jgi:NAD(P)-dependent dehydrogenase (short-subunit alcohol dehydrogenase family)
VVVNDPGVTLEGAPSDEKPADEVVAAIQHAGGTAVASFADCAEWDAARGIVEQAIDTFGRLDILVNSAGILRERMIFNMSREEWSDVIRVQLDGHAMATRFAAEHWRTRFKESGTGGGRVVNTTSEAGLYGTAGQASYVAAKAGAAALTLALARELAPYGVTVNAISPRAATRMTAEIANTPPEHGDAAALMAVTMDPRDIACLVAHLASDDAAHISGQVFLTWDGKIELLETWHSVAAVERAVPWDVDGVAGAVGELLEGRPTTPPVLF